MADISYAQDYEETKAQVMRTNKAVDELTEVVSAIENQVSTIEGLDKLSSFAAQAVPMIKTIGDAMRKIQETWEPQKKVFQLSFDVYDEAASSNLSGLMQ